MGISPNLDHQCFGSQWNQMNTAIFYESVTRIDGFCTFWSIAFCEKNVRIINKIVDENCGKANFKEYNVCWFICIRLFIPNVWTSFKQYFQRLNVNFKRTQWVKNSVLQIIKWFKIHNNWEQIWAGLLKDCNQLYTVPSFCFCWFGPL